MRAVVIGAVESTSIAAGAIASADDWTLAALFTLAPDLAARHSDFHDLAPVALSAGAELVPVDRINDAANVAGLAAYQPDFIFVVGWSQICGPDLMAIAPGRVIGYHPAALPRMRGRAAIPWTILAGEPITAGTLFWMDEGVDTGAILDQQFFHVSPAETAATLYRKHMGALGTMMARTLPDLVSGRPRRDPQDELHATWATRRTAEDGAIDWRRPAKEIHRLVRAVGHPYPGSFTSVGSDRLTIWSAELSDVGERFCALPGQIIERTPAMFTVACGDGTALTVTDWSRPGGRMPALHAILGREA
ncbi:methionyl-tRNA formyltransferase [Allosphingosinicella deserti]|uniref:Methionyl-tRNA formyltransferase n=1 Tax=Allosphingosinicella deserti TaxID=2116704 RepID=A0A2P7QEJ4_9SPHN|nr:methionyl-tRNA formyltransferase [Sphingomonas deserti]PSJ36389.1 methionyl-tRNA formyltransferase [Sphingomonas deserti]